MSIEETELTEEEKIRIENRKRGNKQTRVNQTSRALNRDYKNFFSNLWNKLAELEVDDSIFDEMEAFTQEIDEKYDPELIYNIYNPKPKRNKKNKNNNTEETEDE